jgi:hypothetical protein
VGPFAQGGQIGVVVDDKRDIQDLGQGGREIEFVQPGAVRGLPDSPAADIVDAGKAETGRRDGLG